ncbi:MAG: phospho-sugar mutase, partial [Oscillospiraceae bacterium]
MYKAEYKRWLEQVTQEDLHKELCDIHEDEEQIEDRFLLNLEFGTAGLRGVLGAGTNRMNIYTVGKATQGLANF